jgi:anaerobic nitric oxide reductase transcription regulator
MIMTTAVCCQEDNTLSEEQPSYGAPRRRRNVTAAPRTRSAPIAPGQLQALLLIARDLTASLAAVDRYERLLDAVRQVIPADAVCLLRLEGNELVPVAAYGLSEEARVRRYSRQNHPRLDIILRSAGPVRFPPDSDLPDPFDGMLASDPGALRHIHACLGCALIEGGEVIGALTADAIAPGAFDALDEHFVAMVGALAGAAVRTTTLIERLERAAAHQGAVARELQRTAAEQSGGDILGRSRAVTRLIESVDLVARADFPVLITGETGVGKELVARRIHSGSGRREEPLIHVNCAALPEAVAESELFGHVAGAFTGAVRDRAGKFEIADGGTLFLDEIGELPLSLQPKLLRALQEGEIQRVGSDRAHRVDVRVIAATNRDLQREVEAGRFRADLYHRLSVFPIRVPALRERREDIPLLAAHFLDRTRRRLGAGPLRLTEEAKRALQNAAWPGNVRELENVISRAALRAAFAAQPAAAAETAGAARSTRATGDTLRATGAVSGPTVVRIDVEALDPVQPGPAQSSPPAAQSAAQPAGAGTPPRNDGPLGPEQTGPLRERLLAFQRRVIEESVSHHRGNWAAAARELGMHRSNLHHLARRLEMREG